MNAFVEILRVKNCVIASFATLIGYFLITFNPSINLILAMLATFFICGAGNIINDVFDATIDAKLNKKKPIPSKRITKNTAIKYSIVLFLIGNLLALSINFSAIIISIFISFLLIIYSSVLYKKKYLGNVVVAFGTALPFIFGAASAGNINSLIVAFSLSAFFANMAREITKDFEDEKKDKGVKLTLPMIHEKLGHRLIILYYFISIGIAVGAFALYNLNFIYLILIYITTFIFLNGLLNLKRKDFSKSQKHSKRGMIFSLLAFIATILR